MDNNWRHYAACRDEDPELFFTQDRERGEGKAAREDEAKAICRRCPVARSCLDFAINTGQTQGTWGGLNEDERRPMRLKTTAA